MVLIQEHSKNREPSWIDFFVRFLYLKHKNSNELKQKKMIEISICYERKIESTKFQNAGDKRKGEFDKLERSFVFFNAPISPCVQKYNLHTNADTRKRERAKENLVQKWTIFFSLIENVFFACKKSINQKWKWNKNQLGIKAIKKTIFYSLEMTNNGKKFARILIALYMFFDKRANSKAIRLYGNASV